jgi:hypothetical protein
MLDSLERERDWQAELPIYSQDRFVPLSRSGRSHTPLSLSLSHYVLYFVRKRKDKSFCVFFFSVFVAVMIMNQVIVYKGTAQKGNPNRRDDWAWHTVDIKLLRCTHKHTHRVERERESWMMLGMVDWAGYNIAVVIISSVSVLSSCVRDRTAIIDSERGFSV